MSLLDRIDNIPDTLLPGLRERSFPFYVVWREVCHVVGSLLLLLVAHLLFIKTTVYFPLYIMIVLSFWMLYQEFYLHSKKYNQPLWKGILDFSSWILPFVLYILFSG